MVFGEVETRHVKRSKKEAPTKTDHKHEYIRVFCWSKIRRFDGTLTEERYKLYLYPKCIDCGAVKTRHATNVTEVEVSVQEYKELSEVNK